MPKLRVLLVSLFSLVALGCSSGAADPPPRIYRPPPKPISATGAHGVVATVNPIATDIALQVMREGGNAIDAAVAAAFALGVVDGYNSGIGGGCLMLIRLKDGSFVALDGRETAPAAATHDMFIRDGKPDANLSQLGALAVGIPGSVAVYDHAIRHFGRRKLADVIEPSARVAENGFEIPASYAKRIDAKKTELAQFPGSAAVLLRPDGSPLIAGDRLVQTDLAETYRGIAREGKGYFYNGPIALKIAAWMKENGGILTDSDFINYQVKLREPVVSRYRGCTVVGFPPPSSGGVHVGQMLNILSNFNINHLHFNNEVDRIHVIAEAMKLAFADRAWWLGDSDFSPVPRGLLDEGYARNLAATISMERTLTAVDYGQPPKASADIFGKHTTHITAADAEGNWVALTATINTTFGSKVIVPGTGILLNNQMDDFAAQPGMPNHFGLVGNEANSIAPGKRPLSSMSPTIVLKDNKPFLTVGAAGGPKIITQVLLVISNVIDLGDDLETALRRPRFHQQWKPESLWIEDAFPRTITDALKSRGHQLELADPTGATQAIVRNRDGSLTAAHEPRISGAKAAGF